MARSGIASNIKNKNIGEERYRVLQAVLEPRFITEGGREGGVGRVEIHFFISLLYLPGERE